MLNQITLKQVRIGAWATAGLGIILSLAFSLGFYRAVYLEELLWDMPPYIFVSGAAWMSGTRGSASLVLLAAVSVLALGAYTWIDLMHTAGIINDIQLVTAPWQWLLSLLALILGCIECVIRKVKVV